MPGLLVILIELIRHRVGQPIVCVSVMLFLVQFSKLLVFVQHRLSAGLQT